MLFGAGERSLIGGFRAGVLSALSGADPVLIVELTTWAAFLRRFRLSVSGMPRLLIAQGGHGVDSHGAAGWNVTGQDCYDC